MKEPVRRHALKKGTAWMTTNRRLHHPKPKLSVREIVPAVRIPIPCTYRSALSAMEGSDKGSFHHAMF